MAVLKQSDLEKLTETQSFPQWKRRDSTPLTQLLRSRGEHREVPRNGVNPRTLTGENRSNSLCKRTQDLTADPKNKPVPMMPPIEIMPTGLHRQ